MDKQKRMDSLLLLHVPKELCVSPNLKYVIHSERRFFTHKSGLLSSTLFKLH